MEEEDKEYEVFYDKGEIDEVKEFQAKDIFNDIFNSKQEVYCDNKGVDNLTRKTNIRIEDWAPKTGNEIISQIPRHKVNESVSSCEEDAMNTLLIQQA